MVRTWYKHKPPRFSSFFIHWQSNAARFLWVTRSFKPIQFVKIVYCNIFIAISYLYLLHGVFCVCCIGCSCWFSICCYVECCTWCFRCCFSPRLRDTERVVGICLSKAVLDIESRIAVCVSTKGFISSLERSSFWRKSKLSSTILQHLWGWFSNFFRAPLSEEVSGSVLLFEVDSSHLKWLFIADNSASTLKTFCWVWSFITEICGVSGKVERGVCVSLLLRNHTLCFCLLKLDADRHSVKHTVFSSGETICWSSNVLGSFIMVISP